MNRFQLLTGHWLTVAKQIPNASIHCVVTSPPYWHLRDYKTPPQVWGGDAQCRHKWKDGHSFARSGGTGRSALGNAYYGNGLSETMVSAKVARASFRSASSFCLRCNAWCGELGQEPTPELYIEHLVMIFREVRRVLRPDGTLWINIGDLYYGDSPINGKSGDAYSREYWDASASVGNGGNRRSAKRIGDLKPKRLGWDSAPTRYWRSTSSTL